MSEKSIRDLVDGDILKQCHIQELLDEIDDKDLTWGDFPTTNS